MDSWVSLVPQHCLLDSVDYPSLVLVLEQAEMIPSVGVEDQAVQYPEYHAAGLYRRLFSINCDLQVCDDVLGVQRVQCFPAGLGQSL